jgi:hypothetical protein
LHSKWITPKEAAQLAVDVDLVMSFWPVRLGKNAARRFFA